MTTAGINSTMSIVPTCGLRKSMMALLSGILLGGCDDGLAPSHQYPPVPPIWIVEDDPNETIYDRKDLERDRKPGEMLVIPLYQDYQHGGAIDPLAIAHPFVYRQGEEIEQRLTALGQRENLRRLIFWVPGYFPDGMGRTFTWVAPINGQDMVVVELQRCIGSEEDQINAAMEELLEGDVVVVDRVHSTPPPPPYTNEPKMTEVPYDAFRVVRSDYPGRYYIHECSQNTHAVWAFPRGTRIANRLSADERKLVAAFAAKTAHDRK